MSGGFARALADSARRHADRPALVWDGGVLTYGQLDARAGGFSRVLASRGVGAGDRLAVLLPNGWPYVVAVLAGLRLGATVAPLDPLLGPRERDAILAELRPRVLLDDVAADDDPAAAVAAPGGPAFVLYTSGSTGRPKGAVLSHAAVEFANRSWAGPVMALAPRDVVLGVLPLSHAYGLNGALLAPLLTGACVVLLERFRPDAVARVLADRCVTVFPGVATMFRRLLDVPGFAGAPSLRMALSGAAPCPWELAEAWRRRTGVRLWRGYGATEMFRPICYVAGDARDVPDSIGRAVPGVALAIVDDEGRGLRAGDVGELLIRSPGTMDGYLDAEVETRAALTPDGWFRTGDLASVDSDGFVRIVGRKRERILRGGYSVFPAEVEAALLEHPDVAEAAVIGVPHRELGEEVAAFVALKPGAHTTADDLVAYSRGRLAGFKYPRRVTLLDALPRSATGKILKSELRRAGVRDSDTR